MLFECKFSANPTYVGRSGYEQLLAYMAEARSGLAPACAGVLVGPDEVVRRAAVATTAVGEVHVTGASGVGGVLARTVLSKGRTGAALV